jgi:hypothetical protein
MENDPESRKVANNFFHNKNINTYDNPNIYGVDLLVSGSSQSIELEHRIIWDGKKFPFTTVHVPERKKKFVIDQDASYAVFNNDFTYIMVCSNTNIKKYKDSLKEVPNTAVAKGEKFYDIPAKLFNTFSVSTGEKI